MVATACALFPTLDGLGGGADASEAAAGDASPEAAGDGGSDGGRWCDSLSPAPMFCDDFDDQGPFTRWTDQNVQNSGALSRDPTAFRSAPNALLSVAAASTTSSPACVFLQTNATKSQVHVAYDMQIDARDTSVGYAEINYIRFATPALNFSVYLRVYDDPNSTTTLTSEAYLADGGVPAHDVGLAGSPRFDTWSRVTVDLDLTSHTLSATVDGKVAATQTLEPDLYAPGPVTVNVGIGYTGHPSTADWDIRYDNVTIDWQ